MLVPAVIYAAVQHGDGANLRGWAVPAATDIAFSLAVLSLFSSRVPASLKVFLTALAIIDDLGAVVIIATFYTDEVQVWALAAASACLGVLVVLNLLKVQRLAIYLAVGALLWWFTFRSGVHPTVAGVALAFTIPLVPHSEGVDDSRSPLHRLEGGLHRWVAFLVVPVFGFTNAGVKLSGSLGTLAAPVPLGIALGLFLGKQLGVTGLSWIAVRSRLAALPQGASWRQFHAVAVVCGIGFTMSLFIALLAFRRQELQDAAKIGVIAGSLCSGLVGAALLATLPRLSGSAATGGET